MKIVYYCKRTDSKELHNKSIKVAEQAESKSKMSDEGD